MSHPIGEVMSTTMQKIREMIDLNTIIGDSITTPDGVTLIPVSKVSFGFASGGSDFSGKKAEDDKNFGGGAGAGVKITPVAFVVVKEGSVRIMSIDPPAGSSVDRLVDALPDLVEKISDIVDKKKDKAE